MTIYDGDSDASPMIGKYCGVSLPPSQVSSKNEALILLTTDHSITKKGFKLTYNPLSEYLPGVWVS